MPSDPLHAEQGLTAFARRVQALGERATRAKAFREQVERDLQAREREVVGLSETIERLTMVSELYQVLMDGLVNNQVKSITSVVTDGLQAIFFDQTLAFEAEVTQRYNKLAIDFYIKQGTDMVPVRGHPLESFGGGPASIASFILRVLTLRRLKKFPLLCLDETLAAVSDEYIEPAGQFLQKLTAKLGIEVLLVTHKQSFLDHATVAYQGREEVAEDGTWSLGLRRLRGHT